VNVTVTVPVALTAALVICAWSPAPGFDAAGGGSVAVGTVVVDVVVVVVVGVRPAAQVESSPPAQLHSPARQAGGTCFAQRRFALPCSRAHFVLVAALQLWRLHGSAACPVRAIAAMPSTSHNATDDRPRAIGRS
jgi:hypothetical protein